MPLDSARREHLRALAEKLHAAVVVVGEDGLVVCCNRLAEQLVADHAPVEGQSLEALVAKQAPGVPRAELETLTVRQREVLQLIAEGWPTRDIARKLKLSVKTIETHRAHLLQRLQVDSVARLVRYAVSAGLVPPHP